MNVGINLRAGNLGPRQMYYGWWIVLTVFTLFSLGFGARMCFAIFLKPMSLELGWSRALTSSGYSLHMVAYSVGSLAMGGITDRYGPRAVMAGGTFLMAAGLLLAGTIGSLWQFYLTYGVLSGLGIGALYAPGTGTVAKFFIKKRGLALGLAISGAGIGPFVLLPVIQYLVEIWNWRVGFVILGGLLLAGGFLPLLTFKGSGLPEDSGLAPDGLAHPGGPATSPAHAGERDFTLGRAAQTKEFWLWLVIYGFTALAVDGVLLAHLPAHLTDIGFSREVAALAAGILPLTFALGAVILGSLADRADRRTVLKVAFVLAIPAVFLLMGIDKTSGAGLYLVVILFGFILGAIYPTFIGLAGDLFGRRSMAAIAGVGTLGVGITACVGSWLGGFLYDATQSYRLAFWTVLLCLGLAGFLTFFLQKDAQGASTCVDRV